MSSRSYAFKLTPKEIALLDKVLSEYVSDYEMPGEPLEDVKRLRDKFKHKNLIIQRVTKLPDGPGQ